MTMASDGPDSQDRGFPIRHKALAVPQGCTGNSNTSAARSASLFLICCRSGHLPGLHSLFSATPKGATASVLVYTMVDVYSESESKGDKLCRAEHDACILIMMLVSPPVVNLVKMITTFHMIRIKDKSLSERD